MSSLSAERTARRAQPVAARSSAARAHGPLAPALAALLALSCGRSLMHGGPSSRDGGDPLSRDGASSIGGNGGSTTTGAAGNGGSTTTGGAGSGGSTGVDAGADRPPSPDAGKDIGLPPTPDASGCPVDCSHLPNVKPNFGATCGGKNKCVLPVGACLTGFANCSGNGDTGCETDVSASNNCGDCFVKCTVPQSCRPLTSGGFVCANPCGAQFPDSCGGLCVDLKTDPNNCGSCGNGCYLPNAFFACQAGKCVSLGCSDPTYADCTSDPGCETPLGTSTDCGSCGDPACTVANTLFSCPSGASCAGAVCAPGFANCDTTSPDCETSLASPPAGGGDCLPHYVGTLPIATELFQSAVTAIAADGSFFLAGTFMGAVDFDPSAGRDIRTATDADGYVTKFNTDGSYAWTAVFAGRGDFGIGGLAVTPAGNVIASGSYQDTVDLDPGAGADLHFTVAADQRDTFVVELAANGTLAWARTFEGAAGALASGAGVTVDGAGAVYVAGSFYGTVDFDPGASTDNLVASSGAGFVAKLTSGGDLVWASAVSNGNCDDNLSAVAVATDGTVWAIGEVAAGVGCTIAPPPPSDFSQDHVLLVKLTSATGSTLLLRYIGNLFESFGNAIAASPDGSVYLAGTGAGVTVFDPGPPSVQLWLNNNGGGNFLLKLNTNGTVNWVRAVNGPYITSIAATTDGGVLAAGSGLGSGSFVTRFTAAGASVWSFSFGGDVTNPLSISTAGNTFLIGGNSSGSADFDPGPAIDPIFGDISFVSRFTF